MSIQYPKLIHTTLPSVEAWNGNTSIIKDPHKSIFTRRRDKVSDTMRIVEDIDASGDRICEVIRPYARGINPFVSVSYTNYGMNGGQNRQTCSSGGTLGKGQAYLPYTIMRGGVFRPPIIAPRDLLPISRQAYSWTPLSTRPSYIKQTIDCMEGKDLRQVKKNRLGINQHPVIWKNIQNVTPMNNTEQYLTSANSHVGRPVIWKKIQNVIPMNNTEQYLTRAPGNSCVGRPTIAFRVDKLKQPENLPEQCTRNGNYKSVSTNISDLLSIRDYILCKDAHRYTKKKNWICAGSNVYDPSLAPINIINEDFIGLRDTLQGSVSTNPSQRCAAPIGNSVGVDSIRLRDTIQSSVHTNPRGRYEAPVVIDVNLEPALTTSGRTNMTYSNRYNLKPDIVKIPQKLSNFGAYEASGLQTRMESVQPISEMSYNLTSKKMG